VATVLLPGALFAADPENPLAALAFVLYLGWPAMHGAMKRYQHRHITYGNRCAHYDVQVRRFVVPYALAALAFVLGSFAVIFALVMATAGLDDGRLLPATTQDAVTWALPVYLLFLLTGPYLQVRLANLAWSGTGFPGLRIRCDMKAFAFTRLQLANALLTVLTLGLYRPFAVVRVYRYRLACLSLQVHEDFESISAESRRVRPGAAGDGAADLLGLDLSW
jgi:uncharacterized membrane protein YjgN (DUF898 family)